MGYDIAIGKAWAGLEHFGLRKTVTVKFFSDEYTIDPENKRIVLAGSAVLAKDFVSILVLHYLQKKLEGLPALTGEWVSFKELPAGEIYYPAFRKRAIEPVIRKNKGTDTKVVLESFSGVPVLVESWAADDEFSPEANILFDKSIGSIFCTEDVAVLAGFVAKYL